MCGAPQRGLLRLIIRIRSRTSCGTLGRPGFPWCIFHVQNKRKPFPCQATTVSALTIISADFQSVHANRSQTQKIRSVGLSFSRLGAERRKTVSCCRKATFSSRSCVELLNIEARAPTAVNKACIADQRSRRESINFNDYRSIRVFWMDTQFGIDHADQYLSSS
jgi:hypothetical protein